MAKLSILIPARNEMFLGKTIENILENIEADTEIIAVLDGYKPTPPLPASERVTVIYNPESVGQRAATNQAAKLSQAKYVMKVDAHCAFDKGFDRKMLEAIAGHDDWTMVPLMKNLHAFDWVCSDGHRRYQGPSGPCAECNKPTQMDILWRGKDSPKSVSYCFDSTPHFQYFGDFAKRPEGQGEITPTMSLQGSCWMLTRNKYWELKVCDENFGSWGSQGIEVAVKTWLSGGAVMVNKNTWYAHMFRTQGGDFGFPYPISGKDQKKAQDFARDLFFNNNWDKQTRPLSWLVEKFWPVKGWTDEDLRNLKANTFRFSSKDTYIKAAESEPTDESSASGGIIYHANQAESFEKFNQKDKTKGVIFYTDNQLDNEIGKLVIDNLTKITRDNKLPIVTSSLGKRLTFGNNNILFHSHKRGIVTLFNQILGALENSYSDIIFFCEHDVLYHPSHFDFTPPGNEVYYYNTNVWKVRWSDGFAITADDFKQLSGLCGYRNFLIKHYRKRLEIIEQRQKEILAKGEPLENEGVSKYMGYEPGMHSPPRGVDNYPVESWRSKYPNIDIRHDNNFTKSRWSKSEFQDQKYTVGWKEKFADEIPGWEGFYSQIKGKKSPSTQKVEVIKENDPLPLSPTKGAIYYTDNRLEDKIAQAVRDQLQKATSDKNVSIVSASLKKLDFGNKDIHFPSLTPGYPAMFRQIVAALEHSKSDVVFFCEHDVLYHPTHFDFTPPDRNTFYYNQNIWYLRTTDGHALHYDVNQLSGLCAYRDALLTHFRERLDIVEKEGFTRKMGFEPMTHGRIKWKNQFELGNWKSTYPNIDIRHPGNLTGQRWKKEEFRNQHLLKNWQESDSTIPGWGATTELIKVFK